MKCPRCGGRAKKIRLDVYECQEQACRAIYLIHRYRSEEKKRDEGKG